MPGLDFLTGRLFPWIIVAVLCAALAGSGALIKASWQKEAELQSSLTAQRKETERANATIQDLKVQSAFNNQRAERLAQERNKERADYAKQMQRLREKRDSSERAAVEHPARFGRIATFNLRRLMRGVCRAGGGSKEACHIDVPKPAQAPTGDAGKRDPQGVAGATAGGGGGNGSSGGPRVFDPGGQP